MAMDVLRSANTTTARVSADGKTKAVLRWYKCAEGAKAFPGFHAFGHPIWEPFPDEWTQGPGVETPPLAWSPALKNPPPGQEFHGEQAWYEKGIPQAILDFPAGHETEPCVAKNDPLVMGVKVGLRIAPRAGGLLTNARIGLSIIPH